MVALPGWTERSNRRAGLMVATLSPCTPNDRRASFVYNIDGSRHQIRGTKWENSMVGTRILGKAFDNFDFTLNYLFKRADPAARIRSWSAMG